MTRDAAAYALQTGRCLKCHSRLLPNYDELYCLNCGTQWEPYGSRPWDTVAAPPQERTRKGLQPCPSAMDDH